MPRVCARGSARLLLQPAFSGGMEDGELALKDILTKKGLELMQDPRVAKLMQDERVMKTMMQAIQLRGRLQEDFDQRVDQVARSLNLAIKKELRELKRSMRKMEQDLERAKREAAAAKKSLEEQQQNA